MLGTRKSGRTATVHRLHAARQPLQHRSNGRSAADTAPTVPLHRRFRLGSRRRQPVVADDDDNDDDANNQSHDYTMHAPAGGIANTSLPPRITNERVFAKIDQSRHDAKSRSANPSLTYQRYIQRVARKMFAGAGMSTSTRCRITLNDFTAEMFELLVEQAAQMVKSTDRQTLSEWDIQQAVKIVLGPGLADVTNDFARRKLAEYRQNRRQ